MSDERSAAEGRELRIFWAAVAAVALHVADDNFLQPADGVSATDHLVSGLVPVGALGLAAAAYPRVRAGARAALALMIGFAGLVVGGIEAGYESATVGPSGDNYTGFLAVAAGIAMLVLAVVVLWRSRKTGDRRTRRYLRRGLLCVLGIAVLLELIAPFAFAYMVTHLARAEVPEPDLGAGAAYEDVTLTTSDGLQLEGWYVPSTNGAAVIAFPGRHNPQPHARMLIEHGYGVLLIDRRGEGASEGDANRYGWGGERDVHAAIDFLKSRPDVDPGRIGGLGLSVGGELMLHAAAVNSDLAAVVSEGAGTRSFEEELVDFDGRTVIRGFHSIVAKHVGVALFANQSQPPSLVDLTPRIGPRPVLLIWAPDGGNRETMNPLYQRLIGPSAEIWAMPDVQHIKGLATHPDEYERRVVSFFDGALLGESGE